MSTHSHKWDISLHLLDRPSVALYASASGLHLVCAVTVIASVCLAAPGQYGWFYAADCAGGRGSVPSGPAQV